jgi:hypothetical protein
MEEQLSLPGVRQPILTSAEIRRHVRSLVEGYRFRQAEREMRRSLKRRKKQSRRTANASGGGKPSLIF